MRFFVCIAFIISLVSPSFAEDGKKVTLTVNDIVALGNSLVSLDGYDRVVKDGAQDHVIKESYKFGPGLRLSIARDLTAVKSVVADIQVVARGLNGNKEAIDKLGFEKQTLNLAPLSAKELALDQNPIPPSVLSALSPILGD